MLIFLSDHKKMNTVVLSQSAVYYLHINGQLRGNPKPCRLNVFGNYCLLLGLSLLTYTQSKYWEVKGNKISYCGFGLHCLISLQIAQCIQRKLDQI